MSSAFIIPTLKHKRIVLVAGGSVALFKLVELVRALQHQEAEVRLVMTQGAKRLLQPLFFQSLGILVISTWEEDGYQGSMAHIDWGTWADVVAVVPASAGLIRRLATCDVSDIASALVLASAAPVLIAPAMNTRMLLHPGVQKHLDLLQGFGYHLMPTGEGPLACGERGLGRLAEPQWLLREIDYLTSLSSPSAPALVGKGLSISLTVGGTREPLDSVRLLTNRSSGKMGYTLARAFQRLGASVHCYAAHTELPPPPGCTITSTPTTLSMAEALLENPLPDLVIGVAAVSDVRPANPVSQKIKKQTLVEQGLQLTENPDVLASVSHKAHQTNAPTWVLGFAAESGPMQENLLNAKQKIERKGLKGIVLNQVSSTEGFDTELHALHLLWQDQNTTIDFQGSKNALAHQLASCILEKRRLQ